MRIGELLKILSQAGERRRDQAANTIETAMSSCSEIGRGLHQADFFLFLLGVGVVVAYRAGPNVLVQIAGSSPRASIRFTRRAC